MKQVTTAIILLILLLSLIQHTNGYYSTQYRRQKVVIHGDLMIGALLPVHEQPNDNNQQANAKRKCGTIRDQYGVQRVEALLYLLDKINNKSLMNILPGIKLGLEIRDECWETSIALEETIDIIKDTIGSMATDTSAVDTNMYSSVEVEFLPQPSSHSMNVNNNTCAPVVNKDVSGSNRILAVVGPSGSSVSINVQNLLQLFDVPQIGFSATSADLSNKKMYKTFLRVVPSDYLQVRAMIDIVHELKWTYVFAVYTDGSYGQAGMEAFRNETTYLNVCLAGYEKIQEYANNDDFEGLIRKLNRTTNAKVIVCFCYGETVRGLLGAMKKLQLKGRFLILGSDGWSDRIDVAKGYYEEALGSLSVKPYSPVVSEFDGYFTSLKPSNNLRNIWFEEYWQERFKCHITEEYKLKFTRPCKRKCPENFDEIGENCYWFSKTSLTWPQANIDCNLKHSSVNLIDPKNKSELKELFNYMKKRKYYAHLESMHISVDLIDFESLIKFSQDEFNINMCESSAEVNKYNAEADKANNFFSSSYIDSLEDYQQDPKMSYVMNSFLAIAYGLDKVHKKLCNGTSGFCEKMRKLNGSVLHKYIRETEFIGITGEHIYFNANGDPPGRYVILNVQRDANSPDGYTYREVGQWDNEKKLNLNTKKLIFPNRTLKFKSQCSDPCPVGYVKQIKQGGQNCCWNCKKCEEHTYAVDEFACQECPFGYWPAKNFSGCEKLPLNYLHWNEPGAIFALFISFIGIILNTFVTHIFIKYSHTCVVKATTKELSYIILAGIYLCYFMTIPLILKPSIIPCYLSRILPGLSLSLVYGALITKTNRIARILSRSKKRILTHKPRFMSLTAQIIITNIIICGECIVIIVSFILEPNISIVTYPQRNRPRLQCFYSFLSVMGPIGYDLFLVALCTLYAVRTRNLPENFNEAKFIGFSMYTTCVIWIAFIPLYFGSDFKIITLCLSTSFSATVILIFLFFPKVYIILCKPEKNQRSAFTTSKDIRCHFGSSNPVRQDSISENEKSTAYSSKSRVIHKYGLNNSIKSASLSSTNATTTMTSVHTPAAKPRIISFHKIVNNYVKRHDNHKQSKSSKHMVNDMSVEDSLEFNSFNIVQSMDNSCQTGDDLLLPLLEFYNRMRQLDVADSSSQQHGITENTVDFSQYEIKKKKNKGFGRSLKAVQSRLAFKQKSYNISHSFEQKDDGGDECVEIYDDEPQRFHQNNKLTNNLIIKKEYENLKLKISTDASTQPESLPRITEANDEDLESSLKASVKLKAGNKDGNKKHLATIDSSSSTSTIDNMPLASQKHLKDVLINAGLEISSCVQTNDNESDFMDGIDREDHSLNKFKRVFRPPSVTSKNKKTVALDWDYVQSSGFI